MSELATLNDYESIESAARRWNKSKHTFHFYCRVGLKTATGKRIRLRCIRVGRQRFVKPEWLSEFFEEIASEDERGHAAQAGQLLPPSPQHRRKQSKRGAEIDAAEARVMTA